MPSEKKPRVVHNSGNNEWYSPAQYIEAARSVMGGIDLDPASCEAANEVVQAAVYYTKDDDGLTKDWAGHVWMNPPYAKKLVDKFVKKLVASVQSGDVTQAVVLVNNASDTKWCQSLFRAAVAECRLEGRVKFWHPTNGKPSSPTQGQFVFYFGHNVDAFVAEFEKFGDTKATGTAQPKATAPKIFPAIAKATAPTSPAELVAAGLCKVEKAADFLDMGRSKLYELMDQGELPYCKIGRSRRIPWSSVHNLAAQSLTDPQ